MNLNPSIQDTFSSTLLSDSDCIKILRKSKKNGRLVHYNLQFNRENVRGFLGEYSHLCIVTENDAGIFGVSEYFVKSLPKLNGEDEEVGVIFRKEVNVYREILSKLEVYSRIKWKPDFYLLRPDIIVLEDLLQSKHIHVPDYVDLDTEHIKCILKTLAAMHASSLIYEEKMGVNLGKQYGKLLFETTVRPDVEWFTTGIKCLLSIAHIHPKFQSSKHQEFITKNFEAMLEPVYEMVTESQKYRNVICHGDTWRNNVLFIFGNTDIRPVSCTLVDFQLCRYCPPAVDVLFCLYMSLRQAKRLECERECLKWYYECLKVELAHFDVNITNHISWEDFLKSCEHIRLLPILYYGLAATLIQLPKDYILRIKTENPELYMKFRTVKRKDVVLEAMKKDEDFRNYMLEAVEELVDELLKRKSL